MEPFAGIAHEDLLKLVLGVAVLLGAARTLGELARRLGQPAVVGEITAGILLGPSVLGALAPSVANLIIPTTATQSQLLDVVGLIGILFLMVVVGIETDIGLIKNRWRTAAGVGLGGLVVPFALGLVAAAAVPSDLLGAESRVVFSLFLAVALALSAIPVLAKVLADMGLLKRSFGQTALAAGMIDDISGWTMLGIVVSLGSAGGLTLGAGLMTVGAVVLFFAATLFIARPLIRHVLDLVVEKSESRDMVLSLIVVMALGWGAFSQALHLEPILGAFAVGIVFGQIRRVPPEAIRRLEGVTNGVFAPVFLATAGLRLRVDQLLEPSLALLTAGLLLVAAVGKIAGGYLGGRYLAGTSSREALGFGIALNARGVLGIVVATIGLSMGIFGVEIYSMVVVVSVLTSLFTPIGLRLVFGRGTEHDDPDRRRRLTFGRVLLPVRLREGGHSEVHSLEAAALTSLRSEDSHVTLLTVADPASRHEADAYLRELSALFPADTEIRRRVTKGHPIESILDEAAKGYDLIALGAPEPGDDDQHLFGPLVDDLVRLAPCPSLVFKSRGGVWPPRTIMVPTGGAPSATQAADLAFALADRGSKIVLFHVVDPDVGTESDLARPSSVPVRMEIGHEIVGELQRRGELLGARVSTEVVMGGSMTQNVLDRSERDVDLIVLGTSVRTGTRRLFLGPNVERLIRESNCSVLVLNS